MHPSNSDNVAAVDRRAVNTPANETVCRDQDRWVSMAFLSVARMGKFSSDRSIREYCDRIGKIKPLKT